MVNSHGNASAYFVFAIKWNTKLPQSLVFPFNFLIWLGANLIMIQLRWSYVAAIILFFLLPSHRFSSIVLLLLFFFCFLSSWLSMHLFLGFLRFGISLINFLLLSLFFRIGLHRWQFGYGGVSGGARSRCQSCRQWRLDTSSCHSFLRVNHMGDLCERVWHFLVHFNMISCDDVDDTRKSFFLFFLKKEVALRKKERKKRSPESTDLGLEKCGKRGTAKRSARGRNKRQWKIIKLWNI